MADNRHPKDLQEHVEKAPLCEAPGQARGKLSKPTESVYSPGIYPCNTRLSGRKDLVWFIVSEDFRET